MRGALMLDSMMAPRLIARSSASVIASAENACSSPVSSPKVSEVTADYTDMIYAATPEEIETRRKAFIRKWRLKCRAVADSLEEAGDRLQAASVQRHGSEIACENAIQAT
jgi:transposase-like protein